mmetsp:Transcript_5939/g.19732  ORF Transcript_5939/g.19732 Transcript_5939/m.19732 type:complete len:259 (+) Transcript_5939:292-1068(+)
MLYPTVLPIFSPRSLATRSATAIALRRRGCVTIMDVSPPRPSLIASSRRNCGTWVVLPQPVAPETTEAWQFLISAVVSFRKANAGRVLRFACISTHVLSLCFSFSSRRRRFDICAARGADASAAADLRNASFGTPHEPFASTSAAAKVVSSCSIVSPSAVSSVSSASSLSKMAALLTCLASHEFFGFGPSPVFSRPDTLARNKSALAFSYKSLLAIERRPCAVAINAALSASFFVMSIAITIAAVSSRSFFFVRAAFG